ncbi:hypothetical protein J2129_001654 [Methanofollis sp. W23]|nr:hypothetical protein [Methanofollis sp. W23]
MPDSTNLEQRYLGFVEFLRAASAYEFVLDLWRMKQIYRALLVSSQEPKVVTVMQ